MSATRFSGLIDDFTAGQTAGVSPHCEPYLRPSTIELTDPHSWRPPPPLDEIQTLLGVVSGLDHASAARLQAHSEKDQPAQVRLIIVLSAACATTSDVLRDLYEIQAASGGRYKFGIYLHPDNVTSPTNLLWLLKEGDDCGSVLIGADQNLLLDHPEPTRLTLGLPLTPEQADGLRQWLDLIWGHSTELSHQACDIPRLEHPEGTEHGRKLWEGYAELLAASEQTVIVDPETGEVSVLDQDGNAVETLSSSGIVTPIDPLRRDLDGLFRLGAVAIVDGASRLPPLRLPLAPTMFEKRGKEAAGTVVRESKYRLNILPDERTLKEIENAKLRCSNLLRKFSFGMGDAQRWVPDAARPLFAAELDVEDAKGREALKKAVGGDVDAFIRAQSQRIVTDARDMAAQMGSPIHEHDPALSRIVGDARARLAKAMDGRFAPRYSYNKVAPEIGVESDHQSGWALVAEFLTDIARLPRVALTDPYFSRGTSLLTTEAGRRQYLTAMNILNDTLVGAYLSGGHVAPLAERDLEEIAIIEKANDDDRTRCKRLVEVIRGPRS